MTSLYIFNCQNALSCVSEEQLKAVITALLLLLQHLHVENLKRDLTKTLAFTIQIQVMTGASDQYSDTGDFPTSPLHVQPAGKRQAIRSLIFGIHRKFCRASGGGLCKPGYHSAPMCACCGISAPCRPCAAWRRCRGGNAVEAGGCQHHILPAVFSCGGDEVEFFPIHPGMDGHLAVMLINQ